MKTIDLDGGRYQLPDSWAEVRPDQLPKPIELLYLRPESGQTLHALLQLALNIRPRAWRQLMKRHFHPKLSKATRHQNAIVLVDLGRQLAWMAQTPIDRQPFAFITVQGHRWLLPEVGFVTLSFGELSDLYIHLQSMIQATTPAEAAERLAYLVATTCRPERSGDYSRDPEWNGDRREPYNEFIVRERVAMTQKAVKEADKMAVLLFVASTLKSVMSQYTLFDTTSATDEAGGGETYAGQQWIKNQHLLAEKGIFGNLRQTQAANAREVLLFLEEHRADQLARQQTAAHETH